MTRDTARFRRILKHYRLTCKDVAPIVGRKPQTVRRWKAGLTPIPRDCLVCLLHTLAA